MNLLNYVAAVAILLWILEVTIGIARLLAAILILGLIWLAFMFWVSWEPSAPPRNPAAPPPPEVPPPPPPIADPLNVPPAWMFDERREGRGRSARTTHSKRRTSSC